MAFILGNITLPNPIEFRRRYIETSRENVSITGKVSKNIVSRQEQYILKFQHLTQAEAGNIISEFDLMTTRTFSVSETNMTINPTTVHITIEERQYNTTGPDFREDLTLILTEVE